MKKAILMFLVCALAACAKKPAQSLSEDMAEDAVIEAGVGVVSGLSDEQAGESYVAIRSSMTEQMFAVVQNALLPRAEADIMCGRAIFAGCSSGVREATYNSCQPGGSRATLNGFVRLSYSQAGCTLATTGDSVVRSYQMNFTGPHGGVATVTSAVSSDYQGQSYGGGGRLTKTALGHSAEILGKHISVSVGSRALYNVSVHTTSPVGITGSLGRSNRLVDGGLLEVNHNLRGFTASIQPHGLQWVSGCCYPVSGSLEIQYSGSRTGSATITFNGCGSAQRVANGAERDLNLNYCE